MEYTAVTFFYHSMNPPLGYKQGFIFDEGRAGLFSNAYGLSYDA